MNLINDDFDFEGYFEEQTDDSAKVLPASTWC